MLVARGAGVERCASRRDCSGQWENQAAHVSRFLACRAASRRANQCNDGLSALRKPAAVQDSVAAPAGHLGHGFFMRSVRRTHRAVEGTLAHSCIAAERVRRISRRESWTLSNAPTLSGHN